MSIGQARMRRRAGGMADADNPSWLQRQRRVANDIDFLAWLRVATLEDLLTHHQVCGHLLPRWRRMALTRAIKKALAEETK